MRVRLGGGKGRSQKNKADWGFRQGEKQAGSATGQFGTSPEGVWGVGRQGYYVLERGPEEPAVAAMAVMGGGRLHFAATGEDLEDPRDGRFSSMLARHTTALGSEQQRAWQQWEHEGIGDEKKNGRPVARCGWIRDDGFCGREGGTAHGRKREQGAGRLHF